MSRIWWRLEDVSPLAEHAYHTPTVATPVRLLRPAGNIVRTRVSGLVWEQIDGVETLRSNGSPSWCDTAGQPHRALALAWQHPASGTAATYEHRLPEGDMLWLAVRRRGQRIRSILDMIRRGVRNGHHWFSVDTAADRFTCATSDHRDEIAPATAVWRPTAVTANAVGQRRFPALVADGYVAVGGVLPKFTHDVVAAIADVVAGLAGHRDSTQGQYPIVGFDADVAVISRQQSGIGDDRVREIDRCYPDAGGLYALGAYLWQWTETADGHDCILDHTLRFDRVYGAPGTGQAWQCRLCGRLWSRIGDQWYPAESMAHILTLDDVE